MLVRRLLFVRTAEMEAFHFQRQFSGFRHIYAGFFCQPVEINKRISCFSKKHSPQEAKHMGLKEAWNALFSTPPPQKMM